MTNESMVEGADKPLAIASGLQTGARENGNILSYLDPGILLWYQYPLLDKFLRLRPMLNLLLQTISTHMLL